MAKDRKIDLVILGLLFHEDLTGYDIKKRIDSGISFFWKSRYSVSCRRNSSFLIC